MHIFSECVDSAAKYPKLIANGCVRNALLNSYLFIFIALATWVVHKVFPTCHHRGMHHWQFYTGIAMLQAVVGKTIYYFQLLYVYST
jgi:hypothetical protein